MGLGWQNMKKRLSVLLFTMLSIFWFFGCTSQTPPENQTLADAQTPEAETAFAMSDFADGIYTIDVTFEGGSGRAEIDSPTSVKIMDGHVIATIQWSSPNYDYMLVDGEKYLPVNTEGNSVFEIPVLVFDEPMIVVGDTVAMSEPHEVEYTLTFHSETIKGTGSISRSDSEIRSGAVLVHEGSLELQYAKNFSVDYYEGGYTLLTVMDGSQFLIVPEGKNIPEGTDDMIILQRPVENLYLVATAVMNMFSELDALDAIKLSGQPADGWYIEAAREAVENGDMLYAGKYNMPDYELILSQGCSLAIENMMITHSPEVTEKLEGFGIPILIDYSSYESHPLGRVEWVKFYGALLDKDEAAEALFKEQTDILERVSEEEKTNQTVAFFFITSNGMVQIRRSSDYVPKMIELAGGRYIFDTIDEDDTKRSTMNIQMEEFYHTAKDADYLIYNSSIDGGVASLDELFEKSALLKDFKAVQEGNVWCTANSMYQESMSIGFLIEDIHHMLMGNDTSQMNYLYHLD